MVVHEPYAALLARLTDQLVTLPDKPEETPGTTLSALWLKATGTSASVEQAMNANLQPLSDDESKLLESLVSQRLAGVPLAHLTGRQSFMGVELLAGPQALVPRKETELLGAAALDRLHEVPTPLVLDVCTGSGNLAVALAVALPGATVFASDLAEGAVELAQQNVVFVGVETVSVLAGDLFEAFPESLRGVVDVVVCNPPYISSARVDGLDSEIADYEPRMAFDGGAFGVAIVGRLINEAPGWLKPGGWLCFEIGKGQGTHWVRALTRHPDYDLIAPAENDEGDVRAITARRA